jgi:PQQ-dependent catabolism-associated CXXCW motif protein
MTVTRAVRCLALGLFLVGNIGAVAQVPEPDGYRLDDYRAATPGTVPGAVVIDTENAFKLWQGGAAVWIDVLPAPHRPENLPPQSLWMPLPRRDIPGSLWLPDVGRGQLSSALEIHFRDQLEIATKGQHDCPIVFYCLTDCWMSWNAAKRAANWGYSRVYWYRDGSDGWARANLPTENADPVAGPEPANER